MFTIDFYKNNSENNKLNKSLHLTDKVTINGVLRDNCSVISPSIIIEFTNDILNYNYCYIKKFKRYYYIEDIISLNGLNKTFYRWELTLSCDVLMSFRDQLYELDCLIERNEFIYDDFIIDDLPLIKQSEEYKIIKPTVWNNSSRGTNSLKRFTSSNNEIFYLTVAPMIDIAGVSNNTTDTALSTTYSFNKGEYNSAIGSLSNWHPTDIFAHRSDYLVSARMMPISWSGDKEELIAGGIGTGIQANRCRSKNNQYFCFFNIKNLVKDFSDYPPYTDWKIYMPYYGFIDFDIKKIKYFEDNTVNDYWLMFLYSIDFNTGSITFNCYSADVRIDRLADDTLLYTERTGSNKLLFTFEYNISIEIPIGSTNTTQVMNNLVMDTMKNSISLVGGLSISNSQANIAQLYASKRYDRPSKKAKAIGSMVYEAGVEKTLLSSIGLNNSYNINFASTKSVGAGIGKFYLSDEIAIVKFKKNIQYPENYGHFFGKPLNKVFKLNQMLGYTKIADVHLTNLSNATNEEKDEIENILHNGIII